MIGDIRGNGSTSKASSEKILIISLITLSGQLLYWEAGVIYDCGP